jgi:hypothetical protein
VVKEKEKGINHTFVTFGHANLESERVPAKKQSSSVKAQGHNGGSSCCEAFLVKVAARRRQEHAGARALPIFRT